MSGPVRSLDIAELRAFCAAVDLGSLGRAARLLRVSQPALSKRMRAIEAVVGTQLVERSPRGITATPAGTRLYVEARKLLAQAEAIDDLVRGLSGEEAPVRRGRSPATPPPGGVRGGSPGCGSPGATRSPSSCCPARSSTSSASASGTCR